MNAEQKAEALRLADALDKAADHAAYVPSQIKTDVEFIAAELRARAVCVA